MSHTPRERYEVGQLLPGTSLVVIGTRAETKATVPTTKLVREASLGHLVDALPRVAAIANGELPADRVIGSEGLVLPVKPSHRDQLAAAQLLGKWAGVEIPEDLGGQRLVVNISGGVNIGASEGKPEAPVAFVEGLGGVEA